MRTTLNLLFAFTTLFAAFASAANISQKGHGGPPPKKKSAPFNFPKYNRPAPPRQSNHPSGGNHAAPQKRVPVAVHHDSLGNHVTEDHMNRVDFAHNRTENVMRKDHHVTDVVHVGRTHYANYFRPEFETKRAFFSDSIGRYNHWRGLSPLIVAGWHRHYFYGGFYYGFHPLLDIDSYFYNPTVYWFYVGTFDEPYYRSWYQDHYDAYPEFHQPFAYHGVFYPTENLRQLLFGVSAMPPEKQAAFRTAITAFTQRLAQNMANGLGQRVVLTKGDVVITHYEILGYDDGIVLEGMVGHNNTAYNYKGLLDLEQPQQTGVFVPASWDKNPTPAQLAELDGLNAKISALKGEPPALTSDEEPLEATPPPAGQAVAEPEPQK